jgi:hypothetical protein
LVRSTAGRGLPEGRRCAIDPIGSADRHRGEIFAVVSSRIPPSRKRVRSRLLMGHEDAPIDASMAAAIGAYADLAKVKRFWT